MMQFKSALCLATLFGLGTAATHTSAQDDAPNFLDPVETLDRLDTPAKPRPNEDPLIPPGKVATQSNQPAATYQTNNQVHHPQFRRGPTNVVKPTGRERIVTRYVQEVVIDPIPADELEEGKQFESAIQGYKDSKDEEERANLVTTIQKLLERQFQRDLKRREEELAPIEARVRSLRKQLDTRKESMKDIIDLRFKTIINSIDGLGFPDEEGRFGLPGSNPETSTKHSFAPDPEPSESEFKASKKDGPKPRARSSKKETKPVKPADKSVPEPFDPNSEEQR